MFCKSKVERDFAIGVLTLLSWVCRFVDDGELLQQSNSFLLIFNSIVLVSNLSPFFIDDDRVSNKRIPVR